MYAKVKMLKAQRKRIMDRHRDSLKRYGHHANALYWSSKQVQETRFAILQAIGIGSGDSVLDVGCGFGDFRAWFQRQTGKDLDYHGLDISPDLLAEAQRLHPQAHFYSGILQDFDFAPGSFDWVLMSGSLSEQLHDDGEQGRKTVRDAYRLCRQGVALNMLNMADAYMAAAPDLQVYDAQAMLHYCQGFCDDVQLRDDYMDCDFTLYLRRN